MFTGIIAKWYNCAKVNPLKSGQYFIIANVYPRGSKTYMEVDIPAIRGELLDANKNSNT